MKEEEEKITETTKKQENKNKTKKQTKINENINKETITEIIESVSSSNSNFSFSGKKRDRSLSTKKENNQKLSNLKSNRKVTYINDFFKPSNDIISNSKDILIKSLEKQIKSKNTEIEKLNEELNKMKTYVDNKEKIMTEKSEETNKFIIQILLEKENLLRTAKKQKIFESQKKFGKYSVIRTGIGQYINVWEDGEEICITKKSLKEINTKIEDILSFASNNPSNINKACYSLELFKLEKTKKYLEDKLDYLDKEKKLYLYEAQNISEEKTCSFLNKWPLLHNRYQILCLLGKGGFSEVYKAYDLKEHKYVACKLYTLKNNLTKEMSENYLKHTIREIEIHKLINSDNIVKQLNVFNIDKTSFATILEYCNGGDLNYYMNMTKNFSEKEIKCIILQILEGLKYLNSMKNKIIHYDIKPQNILFHNNQIKIADFGISKLINNNDNTSNIELTSQGMGTYYYLPPECFETNKNVTINTKVDIWSVGVICYELVYNKKPFGQGCSQDKLFDILSSSDSFKINFPSQPKISDNLQKFIIGCLQINTDLRFSIDDAINSDFINSL